MGDEKPLSHPELEKALHKVADEGRIYCPQALAIARKLRIPAAEVGRAADILQLRISGCQLGCFGKRKKEEPEKTPGKPQLKGNDVAISEAARPVVIHKVVGETCKEMEDVVAAEATYSLVVNDQTIVALQCSPMDLDAMAVGFLLSEGIITERKQLHGVEIKDETIRVLLNALPADWEDRFHTKTLTSGCGHGITFTDSRGLQNLPPVRTTLTVGAPFIREMMREFARISSLFLATGGTHCAAIADKNGIKGIAEDIGRHNAVDKIIGKMFMEKTSLEDSILLSSGRVSGEIMTKVIRNRIPILVSRAAPTCMSVTQAEDHGITLIGFARGRRMNIYSHPQRIVVP